VAVTRDDANPIFAIEPFRVKVHGQKPVINLKNKIELPTFHQFRNTGLRGKEFKLCVVTDPILPAQLRDQDGASIVRARDTEVADLPPRIEWTRRDEILRLASSAGAHGSADFLKMP